MVLALGKFDALHRGHRALALAAAASGDAPFLLSFEGIAQVLGRAAPRCSDARSSSRRLAQVGAAPACRRALRPRAHPGLLVRGRAPRRRAAA